MELNTEEAGGNEGVRGSQEDEALEVRMEVATVGILKEIRRVSDPDKAQIIWDGIKVIANSVKLIRNRQKECFH